MSGDVYSASEAKQVQSVSYGTLISVRPVKIQAGGDSNAIGAIGGAVLGGFPGNTTGGGAGRRLQPAAGEVLGGQAAHGGPGSLKTLQGVAPARRNDVGNTNKGVQKEGKNVYSVGMRAANAPARAVTGL